MIMVMRRGRSKEKERGSAGSKITVTIRSSCRFSSFPSTTARTARASTTSPAPWRKEDHGHQPVPVAQAVVVPANVDLRYDPSNEGEAEAIVVLIWECSEGIRQLIMEETTIQCRAKATIGSFTRAEADREWREG